MTWKSGSVDQEGIRIGRKGWGTRVQAVESRIVICCKSDVGTRIETNEISLLFITYERMPATSYIHSDPCVHTITHSFDVYGTA